MSTAEQYRAKSGELGKLSKESTDPSQIRKYQDSSDSFGSLADNEKWLADNGDKTLQVSDETLQVSDEKPADRVAVAVAADDEHVLRCLGAAVIMHWNTIPAKLQRELFDAAGSIGELLGTAELRGRNRPVSAQPQRRRYGCGEVTFHATIFG